MDQSTFRHLLHNANDFCRIAERIEKDIAQFGLDPDDDSVVEDTDGRINKEMWVSLKTVSHYNLGIALELTLKLLLHLAEIKFEHTHLLSVLFNLLPEEQKNRLTIAFKTLWDTAEGGGTWIIALGNNKSNDQLPSPENRPLDELTDYLEYFDNDVRLWQKRFSYEDIESGKFRHYFTDISVFVDLVLVVLDELNELTKPIDS